MRRRPSCAAKRSGGRLLRGSRDLDERLSPVLWFAALRTRDPVVCKRVAAVLTLVRHVSDESRPGTKKLPVARDWCAADRRWLCPSEIDKAVARRTFVRAHETLHRPRLVGELSSCVAPTGGKVWTPSPLACRRRQPRGSAKLPEGERSGVGSLRAPTFEAGRGDCLRGPPAPARSRGVSPDPLNHPLKLRILYPLTPADGVDPDVHPSAYSGHRNFSRVID